MLRTEVLCLLLLLGGRGFASLVGPASASGATSSSSSSTSSSSSSPPPCWLERVFPEKGSWVVSNDTQAVVEFACADPEAMPLAVCFTVDVRPELCLSVDEGTGPAMAAAATSARGRGLVMRWVLESLARGNHSLRVALVSVRGESMVSHEQETWFVTDFLTIPFWDRWTAPEPMRGEDLVRSASVRAAFEPWSTVTEAPPLSFRGLTRFLGPDPCGSRLSRVPRALLPTLVVAFGGQASQQAIDHSFRRFLDAPEDPRRRARLAALHAQHPDVAACVPPHAFELFLFVFDGSDWSAFPWAAQATIVSVRAQMKWWFVKRFLTPAVVHPGAYRYVFLLDDDVTLPPATFQPEVFVEELGRFGVRIGQPGHTEDSETTHPFLFRRWLADEIARLTPHTMETHPLRPRGLWANFAECGPFVAIDARRWACVWSLLEADLVSGYGYDLVWAEVCGDDRVGVLFSQLVKHENRQGASRRPNFNARSVGEATALFVRLRHRGLSSDVAALASPPRTRTDHGGAGAHGARIVFPQSPEPVRLLVEADALEGQE